MLNNTVTTASSLPRSPSWIAQPPVSKIPLPHQLHHPSCHCIRRRGKRPIRNMGIPRRHPGYAVSQKPSNGQLRIAQAGRDGGVAMPQHMHGDALQPGLDAGPLQQRGNADEVPIAAGGGEGLGRALKPRQGVQQVQGGSANRAQLHPVAHLARPDALGVAQA